MITIQKVFIAFACAACVMACSESPFISKEEALRILDSINVARDPFHAVKNVVAIIDNDIYYFNRLDSLPRKLTNTPEQQKTHVNLSPDKTEIAYLNENGSPVII